MSEESNAKPILDEDGEDTDTIIEEKDHTSESTGPKGSYQKVPGTDKTIAPDGRVYTQTPPSVPRLPEPGLLSGGGISIDFPDIDISVGDIHAPDLNIHEPLLNVEIPQPLVDIDIPQPLLNVNIPEALVDIDITEPLLNVDIPEPLINVNIPEPLININIPEPLIDIDIPEPLMIMDIVGPLVDIPDFPEIPPWPDITLPDIPENLVNIVGPMIEIPDFPEEGLIQIGDINMPEIVGIDIPLDEIPEVVQYGIAGGAILLGIGMLLFGAGSTISSVKGFTKTIRG